MLRKNALLIALVAASADAAYLRASESRRLAGHGGHDDGDCHDDPEWHHKNRGPDYDCAWVAGKPDTRCSVRGVSGKVEGTVVASEACKEACGGCMPMPGADDDEHGCKPSTGYTWCESLGECIRTWETDCPGTSDADKCVDAGGYPVYIGPTPNDMLCKFPCGDDWTDCPIGRDPSTSPPCPPDNPEASFAVPSEACLAKCKNYIEPFCEQFDYPSACTSEVDGPFLNLAARCFTLGGGVGAEPSAEEDLHPWVPCPAIWAPVCGNGTTWDNDCVAEAHGVTVFVDGECDKPCTKEYVPVCADGVTYGNKCLAENAGNTEWTDGACKEPCTKELVPVCGSDGETYDNSCLAENAGVTYTEGACE